MEAGKSTDSEEKRKRRASTSAGQDATSPAQPAQPPELSEEDKQEIRAWLDRVEKPFHVGTYPLSRKRKRKSRAQVQEDLWEPRLSVQYEVKPRDKWESMRKFKKCILGSESIAAGQCILVRYDDSEGVKLDTANQWKARVLEIRALDTEHVYIRVVWLNRPEDLQQGRQPYHGKNELVPTNQMDVIDAMAVNGTVEVIHWNDSDDDSTAIEDQYFWRQTYDPVNTNTFSKLRNMCVDEQPANPDEMILQCSNVTCQKWQHLRCVSEKALREYERSNSKKSAHARMEKRARAKTRETSPDATPVIKVEAKEKHLVSAVFIKGLPDGAKDTPAKATEVVITGPDAEHAEGLLCLFCNEPIVEG